MKTPPITCEQAIEKSAPWLEAQLSPAEMEQVGEHLDSCPHCAELFQRLDAMDLRPPSTRLSLGPDYWKSMDKALQKEMKNQWGRNRWLDLSKKVLPYAIVFSLLIGWAMYERHRSSQLMSQISDLESQLQVQEEVIERHERAHFEPKPIDRDSFVVPVAHVPERYAL